MSGGKEYGGQRNFRTLMRPSGPRSLGKIEKAENPGGAMRRLLHYLVPYGIRLAAVFLLVLLHTLLGLAAPLLTGLAIDRFISSGDSAGLMMISALMLLVFLFAGLAQGISGRMMSSLSQDALQRIRGEVFLKMQRLPLSFYDRTPPGELMSRLTNDMDTVNQVVAQNMVALAAGVLSLAGILAAMFLLNARLAAACMTIIPLLFWFTRSVSRFTRKRFRDLQEEMGNLNGYMEETLSGGKVVKAFRRNDAVMETFRRRNSEVCRIGTHANIFALMLMPLTGVLGNLLVIIIVSTGAFMALSGSVSVGVIASFIGYGQNFINPLRQIATVFNSFQSALAGAERIFGIIDAQEEQEGPEGRLPSSVAGEVRFGNVWFSYVPGVPVIRGISLRALPGQTVAIVGPTGAGKTTIINLLARFYEIDSGEISIDGRDIRELARSTLRSVLGIVFQDTFLFGDTVMENIRFGRPTASDDAVVRAAVAADADFFIRQLPMGYHTLLSEKASNLSQGQRQLLSIARAILSDPPVLVLDEATSSVDTRTEARIQLALQRLMRGRTAFVIAHRLSTIRNASQVLVMNRGEIVERGTHRELLEKGGVYHRLYVSQFKGEEEHLLPPSGKHSS